MKTPILTVEISHEHDVVLSRQRARQLASLLGFDRQEEVRIATAVSEIARNAFQYASRGKVEFSIENARKLEFEIVISDRGTGIKDKELILDGQYKSKTGMGLGLLGARRLMDGFHLETSREQGTVVTLKKFLPSSFTYSTAAIAKITAQLYAMAPQNHFEELQRQNQDLLGTMAELEERQRQLAQLNRELEDTNRGVVALYAELDEKADSLKRASEIKTRFLSNMTHEFRTPLNSILSLARILMDHVDGELNSEQRKQVNFIQKSASDLSDLVNDLLDLAKVEAGKIVIRPSEFEITNLFGALRGVLRPLLAQNSSVNLVFEDSVMPPLNTDESKVSQILRNFISNSLKFTERGEIRVSARRSGDEMVTISVADTGIGIAPEHQSLIFQEFGQVEGEHQHRVKGTGLGLPLSKKLAELLGGSISVQSQLGEGSTFSVTFPLSYQGAAEAILLPDALRELDPTRLPVLIIDDNLETLFIYDKFLKGTGFQAIPACSLQEARLALNRTQPVAVILDILLGNESSWQLLAEIRRNSLTAGIPLFVVSMVDNRQKALNLGATDFHLKPIDREWLVDKLQMALKDVTDTVLVIDDDEPSRYVLRGLLDETKYRVLEAASGQAGLELAAERQPRFIFLDLALPDLSGLKVLEKLKASEATRNIPVIISTAKVLTDAEREKLSPQVTAILSKDHSSREKSLVSLRKALKTAELVQASAPARAEN